MSKRLSMVKSAGRRKLARRWFGTSTAELSDKQKADLTGDCRPDAGNSGGQGELHPKIARLVEERFSIARR
jgi:hypothetical protein